MLNEIWLSAFGCNNVGVLLLLLLLGLPLLFCFYFLNLYVVDYAIFDDVSLFVSLFSVCMYCCLFDCWLFCFVCLCVSLPVCFCFSLTRNSRWGNYWK